MLKINDRFTVKIEDNTIMGAGVAKIDSLAVFIPDTVAGDVCDVRITEVKKSYAHGVAESFTELSDKRCETGCPVFKDCGGCAMRHIDYAYEAAIKESAVRSALSKSGVTPRRFNGIVMPTPDGYRNKVTFHFDKNYRMGFYSPDSRRLVPCTHCAVCPEIFSEIASTITVTLRNKGLTVPDEVMMRISSGGKIYVGLTGSLTDAEKGVLTTGVCSAHPEVASVVTRRTVKDGYKALMGEKYLTTRLCGVDFRVSPEAFFQVNYEGAEKLFGEVLRMATETDFKKCADLYCGTGTIGMILAKSFPEAHFTGVEINREAVADAKYNAKLNGICNVDFFCGDAGSYAASESPELVVVDPPRRGLSGSMLEVLRDTGAEKIIYVSCNPFTLARDLRWLTENGYSADEVTPVNMFPRGGHCEVVVSLTR